MTSKRTAVLFDHPPIVGRSYKLTDWINRETVTAVLLDIKQVEETITLNSGRVETWIETYAIFKDEAGNKFKRVIVPDNED